jgi:hypothetical protein
MYMGVSDYCFTSTKLYYGEIFFLLYYGENKLIFNEMMMRSALY